MARRISRKEMKHDEFVEAAFDFTHWVEDNWQKVVGWVAAALVVFLGGYGFNTWRIERAQRASELLAEGLDSYNVAVREGSAEKLAQARSELQEAADKAGGDSAVGAVARYGEGLTQLEEGNVESGIELIRGVAEGSGPVSLVGIAKARLAEAYAASGQTELAIAAWRELADRPDGFYPQAQAQLQLGLLLERSGRDDEAQQVFNDVLRSHPQSAAARAAETHLLAPSPDQ